MMGVSEATPTFDSGPADADLEAGQVVGEYRV